MADWGEGALGAEAPPPLPVSNDIRLYIPSVIYCTGNILRVRHASHKNDLTINMFIDTVS